MNQGRRVLITTSSYPAHEDDYRGVFVREHALALASLSHRVRVLYPARTDSETTWRPHEQWPSPGALAEHAVSYAPWPEAQQLFHNQGVLANLRHSPRRALLFAPFAAAMAHQIRHSDAEVVISHWLLPMALLGALASPPARPHLAVVHSGGLAMLERLPLGAQLARFIARRADALVFVGRHLQQRFAALAGITSARTAVLPMGLTAAAFSPRGAAPTAVRRVIAIGRLTPIKGMEVLIRAASRFPELEVSIAGDGPLREKLESLAMTAACRVRLLGEVSPQTRDHLLRDADLAIVPSIPLASGRTEGAPRVVLEALAAGTPLIASRTGAIEALVGDAAILVTPGSAEALAGAIAQLIEAPERLSALSRAGREQSKQFHWNHLGLRWKALLDDLLLSR